MDREEDINFLKEFRCLVEEYLFLGYSPSEGSPWGDKGLPKLREKLNEAEFSQLRRRINESSPRAHKLLSETHVHNFVKEYPPQLVGGPVRTFKLFDLVTRNNTSSRMDKHEFLDPIDQAIGALSTIGETTATRQGAEEPLNRSSELVFVAMPMDSTDADLEDVHNSVKEVVGEFKLNARRVDDIQTNDRITDTVLEAIRDARMVVVDLTFNKPNVYLEAGYALRCNKTPVFIARQGTKIEFDLKDYPILFFRNITELKTKLRARFTSLLED